MKGKPALPDRQEIEAVINKIDAAMRNETSLKLSSREVFALALRINELEADAKDGGMP